MPQEVQHNNLTVSLFVRAMSYLIENYSNALRRDTCNGHYQCS